KTCTVPVHDAATARVYVSVLDSSESTPTAERLLGEIELPVAGILAAEKGVAIAKSAMNRGKKEEPHAKIEVVDSEDEQVTPEIDRCGVHNPYRGRGNNGRVESSVGEGTKETSEIVKSCGVEAWFPLFLQGQGGGDRDWERVGEVRLGCRFLSRGLMLQQELTAGADEGDNGPGEPYRYKMEHCPGRLFIRLGRCESLPKAMIGERSPQVEAYIRPGWWSSRTQRKVGLNPVFDDQMVAELLWTPQDLNSPELVLEVVDKSLGGGRMAQVWIPLNPFILHPGMPAEVCYPLYGDGPNADAKIFCSILYVSSSGTGIRPRIMHGNGGAGISSKSSHPDSVLESLSRCSHKGHVHVEVIAARGLPAGTRDPQVGVRLRVPCFSGGSQPPYQRTPICVRGRYEPRFNSTFLLPAKGNQRDKGDIPGWSNWKWQGSTPVMEVEVMCTRGREYVLGKVEVPLFPLWLSLGHMTRTWYPLRSPCGRREAGSILLGIQFMPEIYTALGMEGPTIRNGQGDQDWEGGRERKMFLFIEVRQGRNLRRAQALGSQDPCVFFELMGSGVKSETAVALGGGRDPEWPDGTGLLTLPYHGVSMARGGMRGRDVLRLRVMNMQPWAQKKAVTGADDSLIGQCDWPVSVEALQGQPDCGWHSLWHGVDAAGELFFRCRVGCEGEGIEHIASVPTFGNAGWGEGCWGVGKDLGSSGSFHVEFVDVRGFKKILKGADSENRTSPHSRPLLPSFTPTLDSVSSPRDTEAALGAPTAVVGSGRVVVVRTGRVGGGKRLCVQLFAEVSLAPGEGLPLGGSRKPLVRAVFGVPPEKTSSIIDVPGSELREWFPAVAIKEDQCWRGDKGDAQVVDETESGQVMISLRYVPLAVGVLEVSVQELAISKNGSRPRHGSCGIRSFTHLSPSGTGGRMGQCTRSTPGRRVQGAEGGGCSWRGTLPHRLRFSNACNQQPAALHISIAQGDAMV
ncbi:unnamed protein product, partial [Choristocarpus tenellus]